MSMTFKTIEAGYTFPPVVQSYAQPAIDHYALASLDMNPVHTNEEWASRAKVFGIPETVGHGMMTMSTLASVVTRAWGVIERDRWIPSVRRREIHQAGQGRRSRDCDGQGQAQALPRPGKELGSDRRRGERLRRRSDRARRGWIQPSRLSRARELLRATNHRTRRRSI